MAFTSSEPDWQNLPAPVLCLVLENLSDVIDHVWFGAVCKQWRSVAIYYDHQKNHHKQTLPMLLIPTKTKSRRYRSLYSIAANKIHHLKLSVPYGDRCCGSSHGWLATVDPYSIITLLNPFKKVAPISLPPIYVKSRSYLKKFYDCRILKLTLSADPTQNPNYVVAAIYNASNYLAFIKVGQDFWTYVRSDFRCFTDIGFYDDRIFAVGRWSMMVSFDLCSSSNPKRYRRVTPDIAAEECRRPRYSERAYLVKSLEGDLWTVRRFLADTDENNEDICSIGTESVKVYRLEFDAESGKVIRKVELDNLGDNVLFVGDNDSMSVSASKFSNCLQKNSIYFTDDFIDEVFSVPYPSGPFDMGIYNVKDGIFSQHCPFNRQFKRMPPAVWIVPPS